MPKLVYFIAIMVASLACEGQTPVKVRVDLSATEGAFSPIYSWYGYDEPNYTYAQHGRELLAELHDLSPVPVYVRTHNLLTTGDGKPDLKWGSTNVYTEDAHGNPVYSWTLLDRIFDAYAAAHVRPMVEIGFMPEALSTRPEPYRVPFPGKIFEGGWSYPPKDYKRWQELVQALTKHLVQRYGESEVQTWYWEVWNEPDIGYWKGTQEDYNRLYDFAVAGVRSVLPSGQVGGPATTGPRSSRAAAFLRAFLEHCARGTSAASGGAVPLDFISFHAKGAPAVIEGQVRMGISRQLQDIATGFAIVREFAQLQKLPIILSESDPEGCAACSARDYPQNAYRNGTLYPVYTAAAMKALFQLADRQQVNLPGMLTWAFEFEDQPYFAGFRTLATNGVDKPILNIFRMAGLMSGSRVRVESDGAVSLDDMLKSGVRQGPDIDGLATRTENQAAVMLWNYHDIDVPAPPAQITLSIQGLPKSLHRVLLQHFRIDDHHSNAYAVWKEMGSPPNPTAQQFAQLQAAGKLQLLDAPQWLAVDAGSLTISMSLPRQAVSLVYLSW
jgi:xylan 1,4-beta-xylosidase